MGHFTGTASGHAPEEARSDRAYRDRRRAVCVSVPAVAVVSVPSLRNRSLCCRRMFFSTSARAGASAPRPHATSPKPSAPAHSARARRRRPEAQCPAPTAAWVTTGAPGDTHPSVPEGLAPSRTGKAIRSTWAQLSLRVIPALSPRRRVRAKLPGCRHPEVAARRGAGRRRRSAPAASALAPHRSPAQPGSPGRTAGPCHLLLPVRKYPAPGTQAQTLVIPSTTSSTWLVRRFRQLEK